MFTSVFTMGGIARAVDRSSGRKLAIRTPRAKSYERRDKNTLSPKIDGRWFNTCMIPRCLRWFTLKAIFLKIVSLIGSSLKMVYFEGHLLEDCLADRFIP
jgi:hypothetical protein